MTCSLAFVELQVTHWEQAVTWYQDILALPVVLRVDRDRFALLGTGKGQLALKQGHDLAPGVLLAFEVENLAAWEVRLRKRGIAIEDGIKTSAEGYQRLRLRDPEGHAITLFAWIAT